MKTVPCSAGKRKFLDRVTAEAKARAMAGMRGTRMPILNAYLCPRCGFWHLTSQSQRSKPEGKNAGHRNQHV